MNENMLPVGTLLMNGVYRIEKQIGSGGFGNTYVVLHQGMGVRRAMKEFFMKDINLRSDMKVTVSVPGNRPTFESQLNKFKKEAQRLRILNNPHIVEVYDLFEENGTIYYVMDLIDGRSLSDIIKTDGPMAEDQAMGIFFQMLDALRVVHSQEMLHLDIKPSNIMLDKSGNAYLLDFGSSKIVDSNKELTVSVFTMTPDYAPVELISQDMNRIGPWTDLYELGATLFHILTGKQPPSTNAIQDDGNDAFDFSETVSKNTSDLIVWMMAPSRAKRPKSVDEVSEWLGVTPMPEPAPEPQDVDETVLNLDKEDGNSHDGEKTVISDINDGRFPETSLEPAIPESENSSNNKNLLYAFLGLVAIGAFLFLIFGNKLFVNEKQFPVDTDSIAEVVDSIVDSTAVDVSHAEIDKISQYIIDGNAEKLAYVTEYPLLRNYPLKDIKNTDEMIAYFNTLFDTSIKNRLREAKEDDWSSMGYRGYCFGNGDIWINEDYQLYSVNYMSAKEKTLYQQKVKEDLETLPASLREGGWMPYSCYMDTEDGSVLRIDKAGEKLRLTVFPRGSSLHEPIHCIYGKRKIEGSMGNETDVFTDGKLSYDIDVSESPYDGELYVAVEDKNTNKSWTHEIKKCYWLDLLSSSPNDINKEVTYKNNNDSSNDNDALKLTLDTDLFFSGGNLNSKGVEALSKISTIAKENQDLCITIYGHTDNSQWQGYTMEESVQKNLKLSKERAEAVSSYLKSTGVVASRIKEVKGFGDRNPVADNSTEAGKAKNRRVEVFLYVQP